MPDINGIPYVDSGDLVAGYPAVSQSLAQEVSDQLASKLPYSFGTATPSTTDSGFLWYDSNSTPAATKFWDGSAFVPFGGKILQIVRATDGTRRSTTSTSPVDTNLSVTITPQSATSAILVISSFLPVSNNTGSRMVLQITDSSNNALSGAENLWIADDATYAMQTCIGYSTPATTSATTYKLRFEVEPSGTGELYNDFNTAQMYAIEVSA
jgi:hypothetical protein